MESDFGLVLSSLGQGLPVLLLHFVVTLLLLVLGVACYTRITPFNEAHLVRGGNIAAGIVLSGTIVALAIPLGATLATSLVLLDIDLGHHRPGSPTRRLRHRHPAVPRDPADDRRGQCRGGTDSRRHSDRNRPAERWRDGRLIPKSSRTLDTKFWARSLT